MISAIASLIMMPPPGFPSGIRHHGPPSISTAPYDLPCATRYPQSRKAPSVNFMMLPLCTSVTLLRWLHRVGNRAVDQALGPETADRLQADTDVDLVIALRRTHQAFSELLPGRRFFWASRTGSWRTPSETRAPRKSRTFCASGDPAAYSMPA